MKHRTKADRWGWSCSCGAGEAIEIRKAMAQPKESKAEAQQKAADHSAQAEQHTEPMHRPEPEVNGFRIELWERRWVVREAAGSKVYASFTNTQAGLYAARAYTRAHHTDSAKPMGKRAQKRLREGAPDYAAKLDA